MTALAPFAMSAGLGRIDRDELAGAQPQVGPVLDHAAGEFMAGDERLADDRRADGAFLVVVQVAAAHADGTDVQQNLIGRGLRRRLVADPQVTDPVDIRGAHAQHSPLAFVSLENFCIGEFTNIVLCGI